MHGWEEEMTYRLLFVEPPKTYWFVMGDYNPPPTTLLVLAAYVERELPEVDVQLVDSQGERLAWPAVERAIRDYRPDMVLASGYTCNAYACARVVETAKRVDPDIVTVLGGQHFSAIPAESLKAYPEIDFIIRGEGEQTLVDLVRACMGRRDAATVPGVSFRHNGGVVNNPNRPLIENLDSLPFPAYHMVEDNISAYHFTMMAGKDKVYLVFEGGRGCEHRCSFCTQWNHWGGPWRTKSPKRIATEIEHLHDEHGGQFLWLTDDNFEYARRANGIYEALHGNPITDDIMLFWQVRTDDVANHPDLVAKMRSVGNYWVLIGAESADPETLDAFEKGTKVSDTGRCIQVLSDNDVFTQAMWVIGSRHDTAGSIERLRDFSQSLGPKLNIYTTLTPFPGTRCFQEARAKGWIVNDNWADYDMVHAIMPTETLTRNEVQGELYKCYKRQYGNWGRNIGGLFSSNKLERTMYRHMAGQSVLRRLRGLV
ncbi:MAG: cobalamin-dependent protein [Thermoplasmata archaeon]|nr:cobalamin-dependent protein [Thermoplasmata archaeon]